MKKGVIAMVKITNGVNVYEVTSGAYDSIYRHQGYQVMDDKKNAVDFGVDPNTIDSKTANEVFIEELTEKPIAQWNKDEVRRYAAIKDVDLTGTKNIHEAKDVIRAAMGE